MHTFPYDRRIEAAEPPTDGGRRRGRPRSLTNERIVEAALRLARGGHLDDVSMRALADELGVPVMTLYNYVSSREALFELVLDHVLRPVRVPTAEEGPWDERIRQLERDVRHRMAQHPGLSLTRHGRAGAEARRLAGGVLEILAEGGFPPEPAARAFAALFTFIAGQLEVDALASAAGGRPEPTLAGATEAADLSAEALFEFGFGVLLDGLKRTLPEQ